MDWVSMEELMGRKRKRENCQTEHIVTETVERSRRWEKLKRTCIKIGKVEKQYPLVIFSFLFDFLLFEFYAKIIQYRNVEWCRFIFLLLLQIVNYRISMDVCLLGDWSYIYVTSWAEMRNDAKCWTVSWFSSQFFNRVGLIL